MLAELAAWQKVVETADPALISAAMKPATTLTIHRIGYPDTDTTLTLSTAQLQARLIAGEGDALGLHRLLLEPRVEDLTALPDGRYSATDSRCPEVTWIFAEQDGQWRLVEIERRFYDC